MILKIISGAGLLLTLIPSFLVFAGVLEFEIHKRLMLLGMIMWFLTAPFWLDRSDHEKT